MTSPPVILELGPDSDVAVRDGASGSLACIRCSLRHRKADFVAVADREMVRHLLWHQVEGERVPQGALEELSRLGR